MFVGSKSTISLAYSEVFKVRWWILTRIIPQATQPPIPYNTTQLNSQATQAGAPDPHWPPCFRIGIDVMKFRVLLRKTFKFFVDAVGEQVGAERLNILDRSDDSRQTSNVACWKAWYQNLSGCNDFSGKCSRIIRLQKSSMTSWKG